MYPVGYEPLSGRSSWAQRALVAVIILEAFSILSGYAAYSLYGHEVITQGELDTTDIREGIIALLHLLAFVVAAVLFIRWFGRAYRNLPALGVLTLRFRPGWTIWGWFVPVLGLWRPKQIANDIWRGSDPDAPPYQEWHEKPVPALFQWWWGVFIVSNILDNVAFRADLRADDISAYREAARAFLAADSAGLIGAILALLVVRSTTARQEARAVRLAETSETP
jgi:hypothetical protein